MKHIKDLKIVITAGASGIGSEIAQILSQADAKVIICDKDQEALDQFSKNNPEIMTLKVDVSNEQEVVSFFKAIKDHLIHRLLRPLFQGYFLRIDPGLLDLYRK